jgi:hypothetical protein
LSNAALRVQLDEDDSFRVDHVNPLLDLVFARDIVDATLADDIY